MSTKGTSSSANCDRFYRAKPANPVESLSYLANKPFDKDGLTEVLAKIGDKPGRAVRQLFAKALKDHFADSSKDLFDVTTKLSNQIAQNKKEYSEVKHMCVEGVGALFEVAGGRMVSLTPLAAMSLLAAAKDSKSAHAGYRYRSLVALKKVVASTGDTLDEGLCKDIWKAAKSASSELKAHRIAQAAFGVMSACVDQGMVPIKQSEVDNIRQICVKAFESETQTRLASAQLLAATFAKIYVPEDEEGEAAAKPKDKTLALGLEAVLQIFTGAYVKSGQLSKVQTGLVHALYKFIVVKSLQQTHLPLLIKTFLRELYPPAKHPAGPQQLLLSREHAVYLLLSPTLSEFAQQNAIKSVLDFLQSQNSNSNPDGPLSHDGTLSGLLVVQGLVRKLGSATPDIIEPLYKFLSHPARSVVIATSQTIKQVCLLLPDKLYLVTAKTMTLLNKGQASIGLGICLSTLIASSTPESLNIDTITRVLSLSNNLLKSSSTSDLQVAVVQIQIAWLLLKSLMCLGPAFVKVHLSHMLLLWKGALPKPFTRDQLAQKTPQDLEFLLHVKNAALGAVLSFLKCNQQLLTSDLTKRVAVMLNYTWAFLEAIGDTVEAGPGSEYSAVKRRLLQCYVQLGRADSHASLLPQAVSCFAGADYKEDILATAKCDSLWTSRGFGVTSLAEGDAFKDVEQNPPIEKLLSTPFLSIPSLEHDLEILFDDICPIPPTTGIVDASILLFSNLFPFQPAKVQESLLEQMRTHMSSHTKATSQLRGEAVVVNCLVALNRGLKKKARNMDARVVAQLLELLKGSIKHEDSRIRLLAAENLGLLCPYGGASFVTAQIKHIIDQIVAETDPHTRSGCSLSLGYIFRFSQPGHANLKTVLGILISLAKDPHPIVHYWALKGVDLIVDSSSFNPGSASSLLSTIAGLYIVENHDEVASVASQNIAAELNNVRVLAQVLHGLVIVMGPEIVAHREIRLMCDSLWFEDPSHAISIVQEALVFDVSMFNLQDVTSRLLAYLTHESPAVRDLAVQALHQLVKIYTIDLSGKELHIWLVYNSTLSEEVAKFISAWVEASAADSGNGRIHWVLRIQRLMTLNLNASGGSVGAGGQAQHTEDESAAITVGESTTGEPLRWQTRALAMESLIKIMEDAKITPPILAKIGDIIRLAFTCSTSDIVNLRLLGIKLLSVVVSIGDIPDPDFPDVPLLEQYQAQISSALSPAFGADSTTELASRAVCVCGQFVSSGIVKNLERLRLLKFLTAALAGPNTLESVGDLKPVGPNNQLKLRLAVLAAWADIKVQSHHKEYLRGLVAQYQVQLTPLWIGAIKEYAQIKFEPEPGFDNLYSSLSGQSRLESYKDTWKVIVHAVSSVPDEQSSFFFVLFGICFEYLTHSSDLEILHTLHNVCVSAGNRVFEPSIFSELLDLFDRLMLTVSLEEKAVLAKICMRLCVSNSASKGPEAAADDWDHITQLFELLRVCMLGLGGVLPISEAPVKSYPQQELAQFAQESFTSLSTMLKAFPTIVQADLVEVFAHIYLSILSTAETPILAYIQFLRDICDAMVTVGAQEDISALASGFVRELVTKHSGSQCVISLTTVITKVLNVQLSQSVISDISDRYMELVDNDLQTALGCISAVMGVSDNSPAAQNLTLELIPQLVKRLENTDTRAHIIELLFQYSVNHASSGSYSLIMPVLVWHASTSSRYANEKLLALAGKDQQIFRSVVQALSASQKQVLEQTLRGAQDDDDDDDDGDEFEEPQIQLKSFA